MKNEKTGLSFTKENLGEWKGKKFKLANGMIATLQGYEKTWGDYDTQPVFGIINGNKFKFAGLNNKVWWSEDGTCTLTDKDEDFTILEKCE